MFNREILETLKESFEAKRIQEEKNASLRAEEAEKKNPELKKIGLAMRSVGLRILEESVKGGKDLPQRISAIQEENKALQLAYRAQLEKMGLPTDYTTPHRNCPICQDEGFICGKMCTCFRKELVMESYRHSGIGKLLKKQSFETFDLSWYSTALLPEKRYSARDVMKQILEDCKEYAEHFSPDSPSLLFIGGTGLGKTHLSSAIAGVAIGKGYDVVYESAPSVAATFEKERFQTEENSGGTQRLFDAALLILDDLGTEPVTKASASALYHLINYRASVAQKPTIISTNLTYRQLEKQYDAAVVSRLLGEFEVKLFQGEDIRMAKLK